MLDLKGKKLTAWEELYDYYAPLLYGSIRDKTPADKALAILADSFIEIFRRIDEYHAERELFFTWMYKITLVACQKATQSGVPFFASAILQNPNG